MTNARQNYLFAVVGGLIAFILILLSQHQTELDLWTAWQTEEYSHGLLIPFIAILLAWHLLTENKPVIKASWAAIPCLVVAGGLQLVSRLSAFGMAEEYGLVIAIAGISLGFLGRRATWVLAPALIYLFFAVPLPHLVQANLSQGLQLLSSTLGVWPLDAMGIPVYQEGNVIDLGGYKLQVVEACSGLRYLFPLMSFGYLIAFLLKDRFWKRALIFLSSIPITIGLNSLRITIIGLTVDQWGPSMAEGFIHDFEGWVVFVICILILMAETWTLRRLGSKGHFRYEYLSLAKGPLFGGIQDAKAPSVATLLAAALLALLFGTGQIAQLPEIIPDHPPMSSFPKQLGDWHGQEEPMGKDVLDALNLSDYWIANYKNDSSPAPVNFYIAYYASQRVGTTTHSPSNCIPGGGWQITKSWTETISLPDNQSVTLTSLTIQRERATELVYYWFDERGRDLTETYGAKWHLLWDSILMHRSDGALIRLVTPVAEGEDEAAAAHRLNGFLGLVYPEIHRFVPGAPAINAVAAP